MWYFTDVADWFEKNRSESDDILDKWIKDSDYSQGAMIVAATTQAFTTFGAGFTDILRIGDGVKDGTLKGVGTDTLRLAAVFPVGKATNLLRSAKGISVSKLVVDTGGPICFWVASAKGLRQVSHQYKGRLLASVDDLVKALKMSPNNLWVIPNLATGMSYLRKLGATTGAVKTVSSAAEIPKMVTRDGSVLMIAVKIMNKKTVIGGHAIYAFRNSFGQVRYMDRTVGRSIKTGTQGAYKSIDELAPIYGASAIVPYEVALLHNVVVKSVLHEAPRLFIPVLGVMATEE